MRWYRHRHALKKGIHHSKALQRAWDKYGEEFFEFEMIEQFYTVCDVDILAKEQYWIEALNSYGGGYNTCPVAGRTSGFKMSDTNIANMKAAKAGKRFPAHGLAMAIAVNAARFAENREAAAKLGVRTVVVISDKHRENLRKSHLGIKPTQESLKKRSASLTGKKRSPETLARMSAAQQIANIPPQERARRADSLEQTRRMPGFSEKLSAAAKLRWARIREANALLIL